MFVVRFKRQRHAVSLFGRSSAQPGFCQRAGSGDTRGENQKNAEKYQLVGEKLTDWKRVVGVPRLGR